VRALATIGLPATVIGLFIGLCLLTAWVNTWDRPHRPHGRGTAVVGFGLLACLILLGLIYELLTNAYAGQISRVAERPICYAGASEIAVARVAEHGLLILTVKHLALLTHVSYRDEPLGDARHCYAVDLRRIKTTLVPPKARTMAIATVFNEWTYAFPSHEQATEFHARLVRCIESRRPAGERRSVGS
jgi:hypothetical protein